MTDNQVVVDHGRAVLAGVRCITFDADDTLWDFDTAMRGALLRMIDALAVTHPAVAVRCTVDRFIEVRDQIADDHEGRGVMTVAEIRRRSFAVVLAEHGIDDNQLVDDLCTVYFHHRNHDYVLFDDVVAAVDELSASFSLGLVTNGNTDPELCGLPGRFAFALHADAVGVGKPDPRMFALAVAAAGCDPDAIVHVGDSLTKDVGAAQAAGLRAVWLNRDGQACPPDVRPDAIITSLDQLPALR